MVTVCPNVPAANPSRKQNIFSLTRAAIATLPDLRRFRVLRERRSISDFSRACRAAARGRRRPCRRDSLDAYYIVLILNICPALLFPRILLAWHSHLRTILIRSLHAYIPAHRISRCQF